MQKTYLLWIVLAFTSKNGYKYEHNNLGVENPIKGKKNHLSDLYISLVFCFEK